LKKTNFATVYDIATAAGVSAATVSRVLNGYPKVSPKTRERVLKLIAASGFRPNANARRLVQGHSGQICFLLSNRDVVHSFHSRILMGVEDYCRQNGQHVVFTAFDYGPDDHFPNETLPPIIGEHGGTEGVLLAGVNYPNFLRYLTALGLPYVVFGNNLVTDSLALPQRHSVSFDERSGGDQAASFLAELGHRDLLFVGDLSKPWYKRRFEGYRAALKARGLQPRVLDLADAPTAFALGCRAAGVVIRQYRTTTAVLAQDDETACGMIDVFRRIGISVPGDISVMGYDDITEIRYLIPALTTVGVPKEEIGSRMAAALLGARGRGEGAGPAHRLPTEIVIRDSCRALTPSQVLPAGVQMAAVAKLNSSD
jgi:DNA-binding LacI/PurR family transcriptional regulator